MQKPSHRFQRSASHPRASESAQPERVNLRSAFMEALLALREAGIRVEVDWFAGRLARMILAAEREGRLSRTRTPHPSGPDFFREVAQLCREFDPRREVITLPRTRPDLWRWAA